jgi:hypothetical protein
MAAECKPYLGPLDNEIGFNYRHGQRLNANHIWDHSKTLAFRKGVCYDVVGRELRERLVRHESPFSVERL